MGSVPDHCLYFYFSHDAAQLPSCKYTNGRYQGTCFPTVFNIKRKNHEFRYGLNHIDCYSFDIKRQLYCS